jgi:hypothetical protein
LRKAKYRAMRDYVAKNSDGLKVTCQYFKFNPELEMIMTDFKNRKSYGARAVAVEGW